MVRVYGHYIPIMLLMCITLHYTWAACVLIDPSSANATAPHILQQILPAGHIVMGVWLILVASCALFAVTDLVLARSGASEQRSALPYLHGAAFRQRAGTLHLCLRPARVMR
jgi:hypothetical protein